MKRITYSLLFSLTLAAFIFAITQPEFVLRAYSSVVKAPESQLPETQITNPEENTIRDDKMLDVADIDFEIRPAIRDFISDDHPSEAQDPAVIEVELLPKQKTATENTVHANRLIIPRMGVDSGVIFSDSQDALWQGLWHIPGSATPGQPGNVVISAHRWLHKPPSPKTFYLIDKLEIGDEIIYEYNDTRYTYHVTRYFVVNPDEVEILKQDENKLTLFTCTPLFSTDQRYVVNAELITTEKI